MKRQEKDYGLFSQKKKCTYPPNRKINVHENQRADRQKTVFNNSHLYFIKSLKRSRNCKITFVCMYF